MQTNKHNKHNKHNAHCNSGSTTKEKSEKILNRVRKLLAMSEDTSSPHEAAIAAKRARKLIDEYQIQEFELHKEKAFDFKAEEYRTNRKYNKVIGIISVAIAKLNDCQAILIQRNPAVYQFQGMMVDSVTCVEMLMYLRGELYIQMMDIKGRRNKNEYEYGFSVGIADQVKEILKERKQQQVNINGNTSQSLVVVKSQLVANHFGKVTYSKIRNANGYGGSSAYDSGYTSGKNTNLSRQISDDYASKIT